MVLLISKVWNRSDNICLSYCCNTSKIGKIEEIQGQITQFLLTDFAHIRTWPVISRHLPISKVWNRSDNICLSYCCNTSKMGKIEEIQGQITQFRLTDFAHIRTWPVFPRDLPISKVWNRSDNICWSYCCNTSKMGKIEEIQGQITNFWLTNYAHIRTWPVFHMVLPISKVWNRLDNICLSYCCNTLKIGKIEEIQGQITQTILLIFQLDLYFIWSFLFPKFETDWIIFVWVIVATPWKLEKFKKFKGR